MELETVVEAQTRKCVLYPGEDCYLGLGETVNWESCLSCSRGGSLLESGEASFRLFATLKEVQEKKLELEKRNKDLSLLLEIQSHLQRAPDLETALKIVLVAVTSGYSIGFNRAFLFLLDEPGTLRGIFAVGPRSPEEASAIWNSITATTASFHEQLLAAESVDGASDKELTSLVRKIKIKVGSGMSVLEQCIEQGKVVRLSGVEELLPADPLRQLELRSFICTPISAGRKPIGVIVADNAFVCRDPTDEQIRLLRTLTLQVGQVISTLRHYEEIRRRFQELSTLNEVCKGILSTTELEQDLNLIARISAQVLNARRSILRLKSHGGDTLEVKATYGWGEAQASRVDDAVARRVIETGNPILKSRGDEMTVDLICVPLTKGYNVIGTLTVLEKTIEVSLGEEGFNTDDLRFLCVLAGHAAIAIENARLFESLKRKEERIRELNRHISRFERLAALGELSARVAHEIRNPLVAIGGFARSVARRMDEDNPDRSLMETIVKETERLERILSGHLEFAKISPPELKPDDINRLIEETVTLFEEILLSKKVDFEANLQPDLPQVRIDCDKMKEVFINLLKNAVDNVPEAGRVRIRTMLEDEQVVAIFENDGPGVPEDILPTLFAPFVSGRKSGCGLGLPISYEIIKEHGGKLEVVNLDSGVAFVVRLPVGCNSGDET